MSLDIHVQGPNLDADSDALYRWAVLYENQRGITLFSTPLYSSHSLLPSDPQPFTIPDARSSQPLSLDNYPLPDGTWRWVSTAWMVDMRSHLGEVQPDGFEYNWRFRDNDWHANLGKFGAGTWVRRRRWLRLMMRPARDDRDGLVSMPAPSSRSSPHPSCVWDGSGEDWQRLHRLLRQLGRDGRKLDLWRTWLTSDVKGKGKDSGPETNPPPMVHLVTVIENHGEDILHSFVYPDSRAQFVRLINQAGLAAHLERALGRACTMADVDFWSYAVSLAL